jgi:hypothetical protein
MIIVGFGTNEKFFSRFMRWLTDSCWSHSWIEFTYEGKPAIIQSGPKGVEIISIKKVYNDYPNRIRYKSDHDVSEGVKWGLERVGSKYDFGIVFWNAFILLLFKFLHWNWLWKILLKNPDKFTCSEFVVEFLKKCNIEGLGGYESEFVTPAVLEEFCKKSEDFEVCV